MILNLTLIAIIGYVMLWPRFFRPTNRGFIENVRFGSLVSLAIIGLFLLLLSGSEAVGSRFDNPTVDGLLTFILAILAEGSVFVRLYKER
ncbi:MAG: hypothetical protein WA082_01850 [Candidatus Moraniibacteriota bacterium]